MIVDRPRVTFGIIVLNGEPFILHNLRSLYPHAHELIVVEGACPAARCIADESGHSIDKTLAVLRAFQKDEDPEGKVTLVTAEDEDHGNGFWLEKAEMSRAYARRATGDYLWQVDADEFYLESDIERLLDYLRSQREVSAVSFFMRTFWGGLGYVVEGPFLRQFQAHRVFAWGPGYSYASHRPPTILDERGVDVRSKHALSAGDTRSRGIYLMHYELLLPSQVRQKCAYYRDADWLPSSFRNLDHWRKSSFDSLAEPFRPHMVYAHPSWLKRYEGPHPGEISTMVDDVERGQWPQHALRDIADVENLLSTRKYSVRRAALEAQCATLPVAKRALRVLRSRIRTLPTVHQFRKATPKRRSAPELEPLGGSSDRKTLLTGWQDARIPEEQRKLTDSELDELRAGRVLHAWAVLAEAVRMTSRASDGEILEVGCSTGYLSSVLEQLLGHPITYMGVDYSEAMIDAAMRDYPETRFLVGDAEDLPLEDDSCDVLISGCVILHVGDVVQAIRESTRVTRDWVILHKTPVVQGATRHFRKLAYGIPCLETHFGEQELLELCRTQGLQLIEVLEITSGVPSQRDYVFRKSCGSAHRSSPRKPTA